MFSGIKFVSETPLSAHCPGNPHPAKIAPSNHRRKTGRLRAQKVWLPAKGTRLELTLKNGLRKRWVIYQGL